ncbi:MAG: relaxase domain-containing protein [Bifidobacteriaceae bacterium]|nr:relaxase domain-containing protein [Bifidobacteriaceae bacterium]
MKGGVILFRGTGADARRYLEADRSRADDYYLEGGDALAVFAAVNGSGTVTDEGTLTPEGYAASVDWTDPLTGESMGRPRLPGADRRGSPRFAEMVINVPNSLAVAAALHPAVSQALDRARRDAAAEIRSWLGRHSVTRIGPRGNQEGVPVEHLQTVAVSHKTSRAGDPHRHIHFQIGTRVRALGGQCCRLVPPRQPGAARCGSDRTPSARPGLRPGARTARRKPNGQPREGGEPSGPAGIDASSPAPETSRRRSLAAASSAYSEGRRAPRPDRVRANP